MLKYAGNDSPKDWNTIPINNVIVFQCSQESHFTFRQGQVALKLLWSCLPFWGDTLSKRNEKWHTYLFRVVYFFLSDRNLNWIIDWLNAHVYCQSKSLRYKKLSLTMSIVRVVDFIDIVKSNFFYYLYGWFTKLWQIPYGESFIIYGKPVGHHFGLWFVFGSGRKTCGIGTVPSGSPSATPKQIIIQVYLLWWPTGFPYIS